MILRVIRGRIAAGRETAFVDVCRQTVIDRARTPGLISFFPGYRRVDGSDRFILVAMWESPEHAVAGAGAPESATARTVLADVAQVDGFDVFDGLEPAFRGLLDAPGGIVRVTSATVRPGHRDELMTWLAATAQSAQPQRLTLGWAVGRRVTDEREQMIAVSAWPSQLVIEALSDSGSANGVLFKGAEEHVEEVAVEQYQAIGLDLPSQLSDVGARRVLAGRFGGRAAADEAAAALSRDLSAAGDVPVSVAPLGAPGTASEVRSWILVVRVSIADCWRAERLIADHGGAIILATPERDESVATAH